MGLADYMSRNPSELAKPPSTYDENFIIAQIDIIQETLQIIRKRGRPKKQHNNQPANTMQTRRNDSSNVKSNTLESSSDWNKLLYNQTKRQRRKLRWNRQTIPQKLKEIAMNTSRRQATSK